MEHLGALMYFVSINEWPTVHSFHEAVLMEIERGGLIWENFFLHFIWKIARSWVLTRKLKN